MNGIKTDIFTVPHENLVPKHYQFSDWGEWHTIESKDNLVIPLADFSIPPLNVGDIVTTQIELEFYITVAGSKPKAFMQGAIDGRWSGKYNPLIGFLMPDNGNNFTHFVIDERYWGNTYKLVHVGTMQDADSHIYSMSFRFDHLSGQARWRHFKVEVGCWTEFEEMGGGS